MDWVSWAFPAAIVTAFVVFRIRLQLGAREARIRWKQGARLVDVRTPAEFAAGHLPGALNIPLGEIPRRTGELGAPEDPVVVYCRSGARSAMAASALRAKGFRAVFNLGGMSNGM